VPNEEEEQTKNGIINLVVGGVISFIGICFVAVTLWLGSSVNTLTKTSVKLDLTVQQLTKTVDFITATQHQNVLIIQDLRLQLSNHETRIIQLEKVK